MRSFLISVVLTLVLALDSSCIQSEGNRLDANSLVLNSNRNEAATKTTQSLCELSTNVNQFDGKEVEISAILITGREYTYLYDPQCRGKQEYEFWYEIRKDDVNRKLDSITNPENPEYKKVGLIRVRADFQGILRVKKDNGFGPDGYYLYELQIEDANNISSVAEDVPYPWQ